MTNTDRVQTTSLAKRPSLIPRIYEITDTWPPFLLNVPVAGALMTHVAEDFPHYCVVATYGDRVIARGLSVPFNAHLDDREEMPDQGWDRVLVWAFSDRRCGHPPTTVSGLEITVDTEYLGRGLSYRILAALRHTVAAHGHDALLAPVRPTAKHLQPHIPMADYIRLQRDDGLPTDPWLRVHVKTGATIEKVASASSTVSGSLAQWRQWTGLPFDRDGDIEVPGALVPVRCNTAHNHAVYVEPNVWVRHNLR
jgi:hypothetical protein